MTPSFQCHQYVFVKVIPSLYKRFFCIGANNHKIACTILDAQLLLCGKRVLLMDLTRGFPAGQCPVDGHTYFAQSACG